jgi:hypothetical protein
MRRSLSLLVLLTVVVVPAAGQEPKAVDEAAVRTRLLAATFIEGKLTELEVDGADKKIVLTYTMQNKKAKPGGIRKYQEAVLRYNASLDQRSTSLDLIKKLKADVDKAAKDAFDVKETPIPFDLQVTDKTPVRFASLPRNPDGSPKFTAAQQAKLRGDGRLPGYAARLADLNQQVVVRVYLDKAKLKKKAEKEPAAYPVSLILIVPPGPEDEFRPIPLK